MNQNDKPSLHERITLLEAQIKYLLERDVAQIQTETVLNDVIARERERKRQFQAAAKMPYWEP